MATSVDRDRKRPIWLGGVILLASFAFLLIFAALAERAMDPDNAIAVADISVQTEQGPIRVPLEDGRYRIPSSDDFRTEFAFELPQTYEAQADSILVVLASRKLQISRCGEPLPGGAWHSAERYKTFRPHHIGLNSSQCSDRKITAVIDGITERPALRTIFVGSADEIEAAYRWRRFLAVDFTMVNTGIAAVAALVAFASLMLAQRRQLFALFGGMMAVWALRNVYYIGPLSGTSERVFDGWFYGTTFALAVVSAFFVNEWTLRSRTYARNLLFPISVVLATCAAIVFTANTDIRSSAVLVGYLGAGVCLIAMLTQYVFALHSRDDVPIFESWLLLVVGCAGIIDLAGQLMPEITATVLGDQGLTIPYSPLMPAFAAIAILMFVGKENRRISNQLIASNVDLEERLTAREAEVKQAYAQRAEQAREASILRERQRIMEDIHDGFGNRLLAISLQVERGDLDQEKLSQGLSDSLRDLRLIVDSMDTADGDLVLAFAALRGRLEPDLEAHGLELEWSVMLADRQHDLGPRAILSIYRIIQEAATNALRHAEATRFCVTMAWEGDDLKICIKDDGKGLPAQHTSRRGLQNIQNRARALGGNAEIISGIGVTIDLRVPVTTSD